MKVLKEEWDKYFPSDIDEIWSLENITNFKPFAVLFMKSKKEDVDLIPHCRIEITEDNEVFYHDMLPFMDTYDMWDIEEEDIINWFYDDEDDEGWLEFTPWF